jgi:hypothetical protein
LRVAGAAAQVAGQRGANLFARGTRVAVEQRARREHHSRLAESALERAALVERGLHRIGARTAGAHMRRHQALDRRDLATFAQRGQRDAREDRLTVREHGASAAIALVATLLRAGETELVAQDLEQAPVIGSGDLQPIAVDRKRQHAHASILAQPRAPDKRACGARRNAPRFEPRRAAEGAGVRRGKREKQAPNGLVK